MRAIGSIAMVAVMGLHVTLPIALDFNSVALSASGWFFGAMFMVIYYNCWAQEGGA